MDKLIYTALSGAKQVLEKQATNSHNLANATATGFRAQVDAFRAVPVIGEGLPTRAFVADATVGADFTPGPVQQTGRDLDIAVQGKGWIAVQTGDGSEALTRNGSLKVNENGVLQTQSGATVLGDGGAISIPAEVKVAIAKDGTVAAIDASGKAAVLGRIRLVNPAEADLVRGDDGLFRLNGGASAEADAAVQVAGGALEGSNVNIVEAMVSMISLGRQFEMQMKMLQNAESNAAKATELLALN
jgi:flagellar basal-body rod protein FlgF